MAFRNSDNLPPVRYASEYDLPECTRCGALRGDPCRTPQGRTTQPHDVRIPAVLRPVKPGCPCPATTGEENMESGQ